MRLDTLLMNNRPTLHDVDFKDVYVEGDPNEGNLRGRFAEAFVRLWLTRCGIDIDEKLPDPGYNRRWVRTPADIIVCQGNSQIYSFDMAFHYEGMPYVGQVKCQKLRGIETKIEQGLRLAREAYQTDVTMLVFFPYTNGKAEDARRIHSGFSNAICIDLGYRNKQLFGAVQNLMRYLDNASTRKSVQQPAAQHQFVYS